MKNENYTAKVVFPYLISTSHNYTNNFVDVHSSMLDILNGKFAKDPLKKGFPKKEAASGNACILFK